MPEKEELVPLNEAREQVEIAVTRLAILHLGFSKTLVKEFGEERGKALIIKSIMEYGRMIGERTKRGLPNLPKYGVHGGQRNGKTYDCVLAKVFQEYGAQDLGCLYCYVDPAKRMAADPSEKIVHRSCAPCGDDYCTLDVVATTEKERRDFLRSSEEWKYVDPRLVEGSGLKARERKMRKTQQPSTTL
jgi:hypothetical protein